MPPGVSPLVLAPTAKMSEYSDVPETGPSYLRVPPGLFAGRLSHLPVTSPCERGPAPQRDRQRESLRLFTTQGGAFPVPRSAIPLPGGPCGDPSRSLSRQLPWAYRACQDPERSCRMLTMSTLGWHHPLDVPCAHFHLWPRSVATSAETFAGWKRNLRPHLDPCLTCRVSVRCVRWPMASFRHFE